MDTNVILDLEELDLHRAQSCQFSKELWFKVKLELNQRFCYLSVKQIHNYLWSWSYSIFNTEVDVYAKIKPYYL